MAKVLGVFILLIGAGVAGLVFYFIPNEFHARIHKELIPPSTNEVQTSYKKLSRSKHQTTITSKNYITDVTSVSELNPLENYVLLSFTQTETGKKLEAKITYAVSKDLDVFIELQDYSHKEADASIAIQKPKIKVTVPLASELLDESKRINYLVFNTSIGFLVEEITATWKSDKLPDTMNEIKASKFLMEIAGKSPAGNILVVTVKSSLEKSDFNVENVRSIGQNFSYSLVIDSFNVPALIKSYEELMSAKNQQDQRPVIFKLLAGMKKYRDTVNFPLLITNNVTSEQEEGPSTFNLEIKIDDPEKVNIFQAFKMKFAGKLPVKLLDKQINSHLSALLAMIYAKEYYPMERKNPLFVKNYDAAALAELDAIRKDREEKLPVIFENYLKDEVEGKNRSAKFLEEAINQKLLVKNGEAYTIEGEFAEMKTSINGVEGPMKTLMQILPREDIDALMQENGFVSIYQSQGGPALPTIMQTGGMPIQNPEALKGP